MSMRKRLSDKTYSVLFWTVLFIGMAARIWRFGSVPGGLNQDEAFAGYEAWSLLHYGIDSAGYRFPVYLTAWGSGMNALNTYLMIPFIALFGLKVWVIRLPQLIIACLTLPALYGVVRIISGRDKALLSMFLLAVCPWHIMLSRWGLESNLAPGFLIFGLYFFLRGLDSPRLMLLSAAMYGLALYAYATIWPFVPLILLLQVVYCIRCKALRFNRYSLLSVLLLFLLALPLMLFLAVNFGYIEELRLPFLSVPKLLYMRSGEISLSNIPENGRKLFSILLHQSDGLIWNSPPYGQTYRFSEIFQLMGILACLAGYAKSLKSRRFTGETFFLIQLLAALLLGLFIYVNVNRVNIIFIPLVFFGAYGIWFLAEHTDRRVLFAFVLLYLCAFVGFERDYFNDYRDDIAYPFYDGTDEALDAALERDGIIYVSNDILYPVILFYARTPVDEFRAEVEYVNYPAAYLKARSFGRFRFVETDDALHTDGVYILAPTDSKTHFADAGYTLTQYGVMTLAEP